MASHENMVKQLKQLYQIVQDAVDEGVTPARIRDITRDALKAAEKPGRETATAPAKPTPATPSRFSYANVMFGGIHSSGSSSGGGPSGSGGRNTTTKRKNENDGTPTKPPKRNTGSGR